MPRPVKRIVIVGGGTAGWLAAAVLAVRLAGSADRPSPLSVTLIEAPGIPTIGVGEGSWPTLRQTLADIGLSEPHFLTACDASFKQGSRFDGWATGGADDRYYHPFTPPPPADPAALAAAWAAGGEGEAFAAAMSAQPAACAADRAPRQRAMPDWAGALNYGYHLDAGRLVELLRAHATGTLGVTHLADEVVEVVADGADGIAAVVTRSAGRVEGDLFLDCSGHRALLIGQHLGVPFLDRSAHLANDRALALQLPVAPDSPIASQTIGTAHRAGWLWDIGLPTRRGIGCVYSSAFLSDDEALAELAAYVERTAPGTEVAALQPRRLAFPTGHRAEFWRGNCIAIGLSAGFIEPLEASAIVLIELSLRHLADNFPAARGAMPAHARRFNAAFTERWSRIVEFLKLHYALSRRTEPYWRAQSDPATFPDRLADLLQLWAERPPSGYDLPLADEMFPAASYQYVWFGMGGAVPANIALVPPALARQLADQRQRGRALLAALPTNRAYLAALSGASAPSRHESRS